MCTPLLELHQVKNEKLRFIAAQGRKCKGYETNYHSSKGELAALHYAVEKFSKWLQLGLFLVLSDNSTCVHWQTMEVKGGAVRQWLDTFSRFNFCIKHVAGPLNVPPDTLSCRLDLPDPTPSEFQAGAEFEPRYPLDPALPQMPRGAGTQVVNLVTPDAPFNLGQRCQPCQVYLTEHQLTEPAFPGSMTGAMGPLINPTLSPFLHWSESPERGSPESVHPPSLANGLALLEAQLADPSINTYRQWIIQGRPDPAPRTKNCPEGDYGTLRWLKRKSLALVDPTGGDRPPPRCLLMELIDKDMPATDHSNIRVICPPSLYASVVDLYHT